MIHKWYEYSYKGWGNFTNHMRYCKLCRRIQQQYAGMGTYVWSDANTSYTAEIKGVKI